MKRTKYQSRISRSGPPCQLCGAKEAPFKMLYNALGDDPHEGCPVLVPCPHCAMEQSDKQIEHLLLEAPECHITINVEH
jgi:hypothetical protein